MIISMDLNVSPLPEEDEQPTYEQLGDETIVAEPQESAVETMRREREERRRRLKRENRDERPNFTSQQARNDQVPQSRNIRPYRRVKQLPQGWMDCPSLGQVVGGFLLPSKVPLDETFNDSVAPGKRYSSKQVIHQAKRMGRELGLVIDLTNTHRYYSSSEWTKQGVKYSKIACKGRDAVPDNNSVNLFVHEVMQFISRQKHSKKCILVHCTHGHNRTGFMIVHFLMRQPMQGAHSMSVAEAIHIFAQSRPPGIYKHEYIEALYTLYHENPENLICPSTPEWKSSSDLDLNGEAMQDDDDDDGESAPHSQEVLEIKPITITNNDVLGEEIPGDQEEALRHMCYQLLEMAPMGRGGNLQFPGSHPVSLNRDNLQLLRQRYYYATWKADGTRYMMLITHHGCYLIDRSFKFRRVQMRFPLKNMNEGFHHATLIDGEMIIDTLPDTRLRRRYLAYDLVARNGQSVVKLPFAERWKLLEEEINRPRVYERKQFVCGGKCNPTYRYDMEPFGVRRKDFWLLSTVTEQLKKFIPKLSHEADGLIFQGWDDPYVTRTHEGLLKWKYPSMNSVDFRFEVGSEGRQLLFVSERGKIKLLEGARLVLGGECEDVDITTLSGKIIECSLDQENGCWVCMRIRTDKDSPNDINTYRKVMRSISDNITEEVLLQDITEIVRLPMYADRIAKAQQRRRVG